MPQVFSGIFVLGVVLGGLVLFVIFNLLAMASQGEAYQRHLEETRIQPLNFSPLPSSTGGIDQAAPSPRIIPR
jgi:hypothetical protein